MKFNGIFISLICLSIIFSSCSTTKPLEFKGYENLTVKKSGDNTELHLQVKLYNPNPMGVKLKKMNASVKLGITNIGSIDLDKSIRIKRKNEFTVPVTLHTSMSTLQSLVQTNLAAAMHGGKIAVDAEGIITLQKFIFFKKTFSFNYEDDVKLSDIKM